MVQRVRKQSPFAGRLDLDLCCFHNGLYMRYVHISDNLVISYAGLNETSRLLCECNQYYMMRDRNLTTAIICLKELFFISNKFD